MTILFESNYTFCVTLVHGNGKNSREESFSNIVGNLNGITVMAVMRKIS